MSMGMSMVPMMRMELSQRQETRLDLEQKIEQKLNQQITFKMELALHLEHEDFINGLIRWASDNSTWTKYNEGGFNFDYARVPYELAKPIADIAGFGFAHCRYDPFDALINGKKIALARGAWSLFVVDDKVPDEFKPFVALHERGEQISSGDHYFASQLEFASAASERLVKPYLKFIEKEAPTKFVDLTQKVLFPIIPEELRDYIESLGNRYAKETEVARDMIERKPIPISLLRKVTKYEDATVELCDAIHRSIGLAQGEVFRNAGKSDIGNNQLAYMVDEQLAKALSAITPKMARGVSRLRVNEKLNSFSEGVNYGLYDLRRIHFDMSTNFDKVYSSFRDGEKIITPRAII